MIKFNSYKKILIGIFFSFYLIFGSCTSTISTTNGSAIKQSDTLTQEYTIPNEVQYIKPDSQILVDKFYPIGWSANGKFAYILEPADEATGFYLFNFQIIDTKSGKKLYQFKYDEESAKEGETLQSTWATNKNTFIQELKKNGIIQQKNIQLQFNKLSLSGKEYEIKIDVKTKHSQDWEMEVVEKSKISISSGNILKKISETNETYDNILETRLGGYIKSPYEEIYNLIYYKIQRGYEGPPHVVQFNLVTIKN